MIVDGYEWHEYEGLSGDPSHVGMYWPKEYTIVIELSELCPQCGNTWHASYFEHGVCYDCWSLWGIDWDVPDIPL